MDIVLNDISRTLRNVINGKKISWLGTFYYTLPWNILDFNSPNKFTYSCDAARPTYFETFFQFEIRRISELQFRIIFKRTSRDPSMRIGDYVIEFHCDTNVFDDEPKIVEMQSTEFSAFTDFWLNASYRQDLALNDFKKQFEFKISVQIIEFDFFYPSNIGQQLVELYKANAMFYKESVLLDLCYILNIRRLEDAIAGRQNIDCTISKKYFISRAATFSREICSYMRSKNASITPPASYLELLLHKILNDKTEKLHDTDLLGVYVDGYYFGLNFLVELSRDCLLYRLSQHETSSPSDYEYLLFDLLKEAVRVSDDHLFEKCAEKFVHSKNEHFVLANFLKKLEMTIHSRFVLCALERRLKRIESRSRIGVGAAETSRLLEI